MYGIFTYIWLVFMVNVGQYTIHGWYGYRYMNQAFSVFFSTTSMFSTFINMKRTICLPNVPNIAIITAVNNVLASMKSWNHKKHDTRNGFKLLARNSIALFYVMDTSWTTKKHQRQSRPKSQVLCIVSTIHSGLYTEPGRRFSACRSLCKMEIDGEHIPSLKLT